MKTYPLSITNDIVFKSIFNGGTFESLNALKSLLSSYLKQEVRDLSIVNTEYGMDYLDQKNIQTDLSVVFNDGQRADVEMQVANSKEELMPRMQYYLASLFQLQNLKGKGYATLKRAYVLLIVDFTLFDDEGCYHQFQLRDEKGMSLGEKGDLMQMIIVELPKVKEKSVQQMDDKECWTYFLKYYDNGEKQDIIKEIIEKQEGIAMAEQRIKGISNEEVEAIIKRFQQIHEWELENRKQQIIKETIEEGIEEGIEKRIKKAKIQLEKEIKMQVEKEAKIQAEKEAKILAEKEIIRAEKNALKEGKKLGKEEGQTQLILTLLESMSVEECAKLLHKSIEEIAQYQDNKK